MSKITILVAVYNAEKYLRECLDSLCGQTLKEIQIVCIDDCSTDSSLSILKEYALKDKRIYIIEQTQNQGQAVARNTGLKIADGEYITMLDSDDWYAPDALEQAYSALQSTPDADCAVMRLMQYENESGKTTEYPIKTSEKTLTGKEAFRLSLDWSLHGLYVVRADIHKKYPYDTSCRLYSDDNTTRLHYLHSRKVVMCEGQYFYRKHPESLTNSCSLLRFDYMDANLSMKRALLKEAENGSLTDSEEILNFYENNRWLIIVGSYWYFYNNKKRFNPQERAIIEKRIADMLGTIEKKRIRPELKMKLGYYPFSSYTLFKLTENFYFSLRELLRSLKVLKRP